MGKVKSRRLSAAIIEPVGGHGGMDYYDFGLCNGLASSGVDTTLYTCGTRLPEPRSFVLKPYFSGLWDAKGRLGKGARFIRGMERSLRDARSAGSRIAHFHFFHTTVLELASLRMAKLYGHRTAVTVHDVESFSSGSSASMARRIFDAADLLIVHNTASMEALLAIAPSAAGRSVIVPHGNYIDYVRAVPKEDALKRLGIEGRGPFVLFFGQIKKVKGLDILVSALPDVAARFPGMRLIIAGKVWKDEISEYSSAIENAGLSGRVISHIRYIPDELVPYYYSAADIVALPYRKIYQSGVLLMAMSYGKPVVVSDLPGMTEIVRDGVNGFVFKSGSAEALSGSLLSALSDNERLSRMGKAGYRTAADGYGWKEIGGKTAEAYSSLLEGRNAAK